jgi:PAS domain S-box-containing protein
MNILIVDDNEDSLYYLEALLKGNGHTVQSAANGREAFEKLAAGKIDLIISDILMPVMDGFQLCRQVKTNEALRHIPFIIYTATYTSSEDEAFAEKIGADRFVIKPCEPDALMRVIGEVTASGRGDTLAGEPEPLQEEEVLRDHNERLVKKLEHKLLQLEDSEKTLKAVFESAIDGMLVVDAETGKLVLANGAMLRMLACPAEEITSLSFADIHPAESLERVHSYFEKQVRGEISLAPDIPVKRLDGSVFFADVNAAPFELDSRPHLIGVFRDITERKNSENELRSAFDTIKKLKDKLEAENTYLREQVELSDDHAYIVGKSDPVEYAMHRMRQVARTKTTVMLTGETGTGKGIFARYLYRESDRRDRPFITINCASLPANLIESELFGREKGAFTGSTERQIGRFELAHGGTIFLDEIGELPIELQAKLLRVLEDEEFERLGSPRLIKVDVRLIASTNRNLEEEMRKGRFRKDLFYRLNVFPVTLPPLRSRKEDIPLLVEFFTKKFNKSLGKQIEKISPKIMKTLMEYDWPGNVRELINVIERAAIVSTGPELQLADVLEPSGVNGTSPGRPDETGGSPSTDLAGVERDHILQILHKTVWKIEGAGGAAELLGLNPSTLRSRMRKLNIRKPESW